MRKETIILTPTEQLLVRLIDEHLSMFADGVTDFTKIRDYALQQLYVYNLRTEVRQYATEACHAVGVTPDYMHHKRVMHKKFLQINDAKLHG